MSHLPTLLHDPSVEPFVKTFFENTKGLFIFCDSIAQGSRFLNAGMSYRLQNHTLCCALETTVTQFQQLTDLGVSVYVESSEMTQVQFIKGISRMDCDGFLMADVQDATVSLFTQASLTGMTYGTTIIIPHKDPAAYFQKWIDKNLITEDALVALLAVYTCVSISGQDKITVDNFFDLQKNQNQWHMESLDMAEEAAYNATLKTKSDPSTPAATQDLKQLHGNSIFSPEWFKQSPWYWDFKNESQTISYIDRLQMEIVTPTLYYQQLEGLTFPSGKVIAASAIMDLSPSMAENENRIFVPNSPCMVRWIRAGTDKYSETACLSLVWKDCAKPQRAVVAIKTADTKNQDGTFFIDKYIFALFDQGSFRAQMTSEAVMDAFVQKDVLPNCPERNKPPVFFKTPSGLIASAPNGIASAILEFDDTNSICALHFDFMLLTTSGQDGEYEKDWEHRNEYLKLEKQMTKATKK